MRENDGEVRGLLDGLFDGLYGERNDEPDKVSERRYRNQDRIDREYEERKSYNPHDPDNFPGVGLHNPILIPSEDTPI